MADVRSLHTKFWTRTHVRQWTRDQKLFYLFLLLNARSRQCAITEISVYTMSCESGFSESEVKSLLTFFEKRGRIKYNAETEELAVLRWPRYHRSPSPKIAACVKNQLEDVRCRELVAAVKKHDKMGGDDDGKVGTRKPAANPAANTGRREFPEAATDAGEI